MDKHSALWEAKYLPRKPLQDVTSDIFIEKRLTGVFNSQVTKSI